MSLIDGIRLAWNMQDLVIEATHLFENFLYLGVAFVRLHANGKILEIAVSIEGAFVAIALPLSIQLMQNVAERFHSDELSQLVTSELSYRLIYWLIFPHILVSLVVLFLDIRAWWLIAFLFVWLAVNLAMIIVFLKFAERVTADPTGYAIRRTRDTLSNILGD